MPIIDRELLALLPFEYFCIIIPDNNCSMGMAVFPKPLYQRLC